MSSRAATSDSSIAESSRFSTTSTSFGYWRDRVDVRLFRPRAATAQGNSSPGSTITIGLLSSPVVTVFEAEPGLNNNEPESKHEPEVEY